MSANLHITYDDTSTTEIATLESILTRRDWSGREREIIEKVSTGEARRFSTSLEGRFCDIERVAA
jgi:hypothetical protein